MTTVDTNAATRPDSGRVQCRHVAGDCSVVVTAVGVTETLAFYTPYTVHLVPVTLKLKDKELKPGHEEQAKTKEHGQGH